MLCYNQRPSDSAEPCTTMNAGLKPSEGGVSALGPVVLPEVEFVKKFRLGRHVSLLRSSQTVEILRVVRELAYGRTSFDVWELATGDRVMVVDRKLRAIPQGITGVLEATDRGYRWQWHTLLEDFTSRVNGAAGAVADDIQKAWKDNFHFRMEEADATGVVLRGNEGLRPPQIGALHAIGAHWSIFPHEVATVVMPTGTGKTETMLCTVVNYRQGPTLVIVPSRALRAQTLKKFRTLGLLRDLGLVDPTILNPIVGVVTKEPSSEEDLEIFRGCNVVIAVMASLGAPGVAPFRPRIAAAFSSLFVDEAHRMLHPAKVIGRWWYRSFGCSLCVIPSAQRCTLGAVIEALPVDRACDNSGNGRERPERADIVFEDHP
ncbi:DEAD/DEAH box helicase family protein [Bradyrhizobium barranii subsp. barranii]|uniref:DEAD/DEAH box helicase family protein n=1 Tax=Bradyrhizobium barranii subsp. barranii TaxID=2823807 RepID=A0A7Z0Q9A9_9BRAD|nr:DEAD/DEAH box helicase family protein [Bradyrhizobium barranii]UGX94283.1 DEAD/DEAH box helicase family protein [Bradyrhizobium barranii subsp. barranii]